VIFSARSKAAKRSSITAANEDTERRALAGELLELERAWREAEEVAAIADGMFGGSELEDFRQEHAARQLARASRPGG
jgi:hypothetical protein